MRKNPSKALDTKITPADTTPRETFTTTNIFQILHNIDRTGNDDKLDIESHGRVTYGSVRQNESQQLRAHWDGWRVL